MHAGLLAESVVWRGGRNCHGPLVMTAAHAHLQGALQAEGVRAVHRCCAVAMPCAVPLPFPRIFRPGLSLAGAPVRALPPVARSCATDDRAPSPHSGAESVGSSCVRTARLLLALCALRSATASWRALRQALLRMSECRYHPPPIKRGWQASAARWQRAPPSRALLLRPASSGCSLRTHRTCALACAAEKARRAYSGGPLRPPMRPSCTNTSSPWPATTLFSILLQTTTLHEKRRR